MKTDADLRDHLLTRVANLDCILEDRLMRKSELIRRQRDATSTDEMESIKEALTKWESDLNNIIKMRNSLNHDINKALIASSRVIDSLQAASNPPRFGLAFVRFIASPRSRDRILDNLEERFQKDLAKHGISFARQMYLLEALLMISPALKRWGKRLALLPLVVDFVRHHWPL